MAVCADDAEWADETEAVSRAGETGPDETTFEATSGICHMSFNRALPSYPEEQKSKIRICQLTCIYSTMNVQNPS